MATCWVSLTPFSDTKINSNAWGPVLIYKNHHSSLPWVASRATVDHTRAFLIVDVISCYSLVIMVFTTRYHLCTSIRFLLFSLSAIAVELIPISNPEHIYGPKSVFRRDESPTGELDLLDVETFYWAAPGTCKSGIATTSITLTRLQLATK